MICQVLLLVFACGAVTAHHHQAHPYHFGYDARSHHGNHYRKESGDGHGGVRGSYGYVDGHGVHRHVDYVADGHGFRAKVRTNEPGTASKDPAAVHMHSSALHHQHDFPHHHDSHHHDSHHHGVRHHDSRHHDPLHHHPAGHLF